MSFVDDRDSLPAGKEDARPLTGLAKFGLTATEWNTTVAALEALRKEVAKAYAKNDLTVYVSSAGSDASKDIFDGDYSDFPYATLQGCLDDMPKNLAGHTLTINVPAEGFAGGTIKGFVGGDLVLAGTTALDSDIASGSTGGAAGSGSSTTSIVKPTGAPNWTANDLVGRFVKYGSLMRVIKANTTTSLTVDTLPGMTTGQTFSIVSSSSIVNTSALVANKNLADITFKALLFSSDGLDSQFTATGNEVLTFYGCVFEGTTVFQSFLIERAAKVRFESCVLSNTGSISSVPHNVELVNCYQDNAGVLEITDFGNLTVTGHESAGNASNALRVVRGRNAEVSAEANDGAATPFYFESVQQATLDLHGTGNTGYGVEIEKSGLYTLTGSDVEGGTGELLFLSKPVLWSVISSSDYGIVEEHAGSAIGNSSYTKSVKYGSYLYDANIDVSGRLLEYGYHNFAQATGLIAAGTNQATALQLGANMFNGIGTVASGTGVNLPNGAVLAGVFCFVYNAGANTLKVYSHDATGVINGGASVNITAGSFGLFISISAKDWLRIV